MARRHTAYVSRTQPTTEQDDRAEQVTVDLYVLWPDGQERAMVVLLDAALAELHLAVQHEVST